VELTLPGMAPRNTRKCEFVEGNSAFVSWDAASTPAIFLWHRYACYVGGVAKRVKPWVFGNRPRPGPPCHLERRGLPYLPGALCWVISSPSASDCGFALCDYVGEEEFEQDCYLGQVPAAPVSGARGCSTASSEGASCRRTRP